MHTNKQSYKPQRSIDSTLIDLESKTEFEQLITPSYDKLFMDINQLAKEAKRSKTTTHKPNSTVETFDYNAELDTRVLSFNHLLRISGQTKDNCFFINLRDYFRKDIQKGLGDSFRGIETVQKFNNLQDSLKKSNYLPEDHILRKFSLDSKDRSLIFKEVSGVPLVIIDIESSSGEFLKGTSAGVMIRNKENLNVGMAAVNRNQSQDILRTIQHEYVHACNTFILDNNETGETDLLRANRLRAFRDEYLAYEMTDSSIKDSVDWINSAFFYLKPNDSDHKEFSNISQSWIRIMDKSLFRNAKDKRLGFAIRNYLFFYAKRIEDIDLNNEDTIKKILEITGIDVSLIT